jgi:hypothetical protein
MATQFSNVGTELDLELQQGADFSHALTILDAAQSPVDLAGASFNAQLRKNWRSTAVLANFGADIATDTTSGVVTLTLNANDTAALLAGEDEADPMSAYVWDVEMTDSGGKTSYPFFGTVTVRGRVTRT